MPLSSDDPLQAHSEVSIVTSISRGRKESRNRQNQQKGQDSKWNLKVELVVEMEVDADESHYPISRSTRLTAQNNLYDPPDLILPTSQTDPKFILKLLPHSFLGQLI
jgi:hypothetical protein